MNKIAILALLALAGCSVQTRTGEPDADAKLNSGGVALAATAPDGTQLWVVEVGGRRVFFASSGAHWTERRSCGKSCTTTKHFDVPMADAARP